jgi:hypothetical protein
MGTVVNMPLMVEQEEQEEKFIMNITDEFIANSKVLSDYILELPLSNEQNKKLIDLIYNNIIQAKEDAFTDGITFILEEVGE